MTVQYDCQVTVHSITKGECSQGFKVGDSWLINRGKTPGDMCDSAYFSVCRAIRTFRFGGEHPWDEDKDVTYVSCHDPKRFLIYEVRRLR